MMLLTIMMAARYGPSTTISAEVDAVEWERTRTLLLSQRRMTAPRAVEPKSSQPLLSYRFDPEDSMSTDPGTGKLRLNNVIQPSATELSFDRLTQDGIDVTLLIESTQIDDEFTIQDKDLALKYQVWKKTGPTINRSDWFTVPVAYVSGTTDFVVNQPLLVLTKSHETFLNLADTPVGYLGSGGQLVSVRADETGLEFTGPSGPPPWLQCIDPRTKWSYLLNMAEVVRIGPAYQGEDLAAR
jgi:hypothetical protein